MTPYEAVDVEDIERCRMRAALTPFPSLLVSVLDALGEPQYRTAGAWRAEIRSHLRRRDLAALLPLIGSATFPDVAIPSPLAATATLPAELERIATATADHIEADLRELRDHAAIDRWRMVAREPLRWRAAYVDALHRAWRGYAPFWAEAAPRLELEADLIAGSAARGAGLALLTRVDPRSAVVAGQWRIPAPFARRSCLSPDGLRLVPLIHPTRRFLLNHGAAGDLRTVGYSLHGVERVTSGPSAPLEALLGVSRASLLTRLDRPATAGELAEHLRAVRSAATHHIVALERAGLVCRERCGRHMIVRRTERGTALLVLYGG